MTDCKKCFNVGGTLCNALEAIVWYNGHYAWLKELRDELAVQPEGEFYCCPIDTKEWHTDKHTIWMLLVGMFGDWGTSIRSGWIEDMRGCIEFIDRLCKDCWEADERR